MESFIREERASLQVRLYASLQLAHIQCTSSAIDGGKIRQMVYSKAKFPSKHGQWFQLVQMIEIDGQGIRPTSCRTPQLRRVDVITIAQPMPQHPMASSQVHEPSSFWLRSRRMSASCAKSDAVRVVFISARVHPGEAPSSYVVEGLLDFLMGDDKQAVRLREEIVWVIVSSKFLCSKTSFFTPLKIGIVALQKTRHLRHGFLKPRWESGIS